MTIKGYGELFQCLLAKFTFTLLKSMYAIPVLAVCLIGLNTRCRDPTSLFRPHCVMFISVVTSIGFNGPMFLNGFQVNVVIKVRFILLFFSDICVNAKVVRLIITISSKGVIPRNGNSGNVATRAMLFRSLLQHMVAIQVSFFNGINGVLICRNTIMRRATAFFGL